MALVMTATEEKLTMKVTMRTGPEGTGSAVHNNKVTIIKERFNYYYYYCCCCCYHEKCFLIRTQWTTVSEKFIDHAFLRIISILPFFAVVRLFPYIMQILIMLYL